MGVNHKEWPKKAYAVSYIPVCLAQSDVWLPDHVVCQR